MEGSILTGVKSTLGIPEDHEEFDAELVPFINSALFTLRSLGVGPINGFRITDKTAEWDDFLPDHEEFENVPTLVGLKVKLLFDPPDSGYAITAFERQIDEMAWLLSERREATEWVDPRGVV